ncbi:hypothetical protein HNQ92_000233 [Rhabdobacter roseus]|uniref:Secretion system C-terminal sorting domain-containing protein n=1 Tax=Rhabdobacter roseus TaxID=1655419 RepID=A0A840TKM6_9BACT|nr:T9SS type A sorting domain-containing protein [Rhabdobacter roseus]MBB5282112.1 hypothetical protein [Rhabdobacter roseus]
MKNTCYRPILFCLPLLAGLLMSSGTYAQSKNENKKTTVRVKVSENKDGKLEEVERSYEIEPLADGERKEFMDKVLDSLGTKGPRQVTILVEDGSGNVVIRESRRSDALLRNSEEPVVFSWRNDKDHFRFDFDSEQRKGELRRAQAEARRLQTEIQPQMRILMRDIERAGDRVGGLIWGHEGYKAASVRSLNVYPNNPDNGTLNVRFSVPEPGDVTITVTDTKGKEVGKKEIKDFSGNFVGQVELKKNTTGTLFVTVTQKDDGAVQRVVIPAEK